MANVDVDVASNPPSLAIVVAHSTFGWRVSTRRRTVPWRWRRSEGTTMTSFPGEVSRLPSGMIESFDDSIVLGVVVVVVATTVSNRWGT